MARQAGRIVLASAAAVLCARLVLLLLAARPDNPGVVLLLALSDPLVWPVTWIDQLQPVYGARFERGTLVELVLCLIGLRWLRRGAA